MKDPAGYFLSTLEEKDLFIDSPDSQNEWVFTGKWFMAGNNLHMKQVDAAYDVFPRKVWTIHVDDYGLLYVSQGKSIVNTVAYMIEKSDTPVPDNIVYEECPGYMLEDDDEYEDGI